MYKYETINGQRVEKNIAARFRLWAADFARETGLRLLISSGVRLESEQQVGYDAYVKRGYTGVKWARPRESSHCEVGPSGPRALDIRDTGADAGVTVYGSHRWQIAVRLGKKYGFTWGGWGVPKSEGWHFENHAVKVGVYGVVGKVTDTVQKATTRRTLHGIRWTGIQRMLKADFGYTGRIDNKPGKGTVSAFQRFLNAKGYARRAVGRTLKVDGIDGRDTLAGAQQWLKDRWGYTGRIDRKRGPGTLAAWNRAEAANGRAYRAVR